MRRTKAEIEKVYSAGSAYPIDSYISGYRTVNIPRFKHKKKPISLIKALEVRDRMQRKNTKRHINTNIFGMIITK